MKPALRVMLCDDAGERFFGEGPCRLFHLIEETGSLRSAAAQMGLSYSKALRLVQHAEKELGFALTCKTIGGRGGGGSTLTAEARQFLERYEAYRDACVQTSRELYSAFFSGQRYAPLAADRRARQRKNNAAASTYAIPLPRCPDASHHRRPGQMGRDARYSRRGSGGHRPV